MAKFDYVTQDELVHAADKLGQAAKKIADVAAAMKAQCVEQFPAEWTNAVRQSLGRVISAALLLEGRLNLHLIAEKEGVPSEMENGMSRTRKNREYAKKRKQKEPGNSLPKNDKK